VKKRNFASTKGRADRSDTAVAPLTGRAAYEADVAKRPLYHDGMKRPKWDQLSDTAKLSWEMV
jgi:hypothetical protein